MLQEFNKKKPNDKKRISEEDFEKALTDMLENPDPNKKLLSPEELDRLADAAMEEFERTKLPEILKQLEEMDDEEIARRRRELEEKERSRNNWAAEMVRKEHERYKHRELEESQEEPDETKSESTESAEGQPVCTTSEAQNQKRNQNASEHPDPEPDKKTMAVEMTEPTVAEAPETSQMSEKEPEKVESEEPDRASEFVRKMSEMESEPARSSEPLHPVVQFWKRNKKRIIQVCGTAAVIAMVVTFGKNPFTSNGTYSPGMSSDMTGTASHLDAGDADRIEADSTNEILKKIAKEKKVPVIQLNKYAKLAKYEEIEKTANTLVAFALHIDEKNVHFQYLYLVSAATITTSSQMDYVEDVQIENASIPVYYLENEDNESQYFAYVTKDAYMISIGTDMEYEEFCDFLKDLSIE